MPAHGKSQQLRLLDEVRQILRFHHYSIHTVRADKRVNVPVVMTRKEVAAVLSLLNGTPHLMTKLHYGSELRIMEAIRLRVNDVDFGMKQITVRSGKSDKHRMV